MNLAIGLILAVLVATIWAVVALSRRRGRSHKEYRSDVTEEALTVFVERSLALGSFAEVVGEAAATAQAAFRATRVVRFEPGAREGVWDALSATGEPLDAVPDASRPVFARFKHNAEVVVLDDASGGKFGALRLPLTELGQRYGIDVLVPLVGLGQTMAVLGLSVGRRVSAFERGLLDHLRIEATAAALNVRLHREAAHKLTLEKEVDLASAVQLTLVPPVDAGRGRHVAWVGHYRPAGQAGSDFWSAYDLGDGRVLVVVGDVVGRGLAGSMVSAVAKSCCDSLNAAVATLDAGTLLTALNRALWRPARPIHMTCFAAIFDGAAGTVQFANAGHPLPYVARPVEPRLGVLSGSGPMLGDAPDTRYRASERPVRAGDLILLYTDGIVEATNAERMPFGERRLQRALLQAVGERPEVARDRILGALGDFRGGAPPVDDEALVVVRIG